MQPESTQPPFRKHNPQEIEKEIKDIFFNSQNTTATEEELATSRAGANALEHLRTVLGRHTTDWQRTADHFKEKALDDLGAARAYKSVINNMHYVRNNVLQQVTLMRAAYQEVIQGLHVEIENLRAELKTARALSQVKKTRKPRTAKPEK